MTCNCYMKILVARDVRNVRNVRIFQSCMSSPLSTQKKFDFFTTEMIIVGGRSGNDENG